MKGKKYSIEDKIRILRQAARGRSILEGCREANISEISLGRWKSARPNAQQAGLPKPKTLRGHNPQCPPSPAPVSPGSLRRRWTNEGKQHNQ